MDDERIRLTTIVRQVPARARDLTMSSAPSRTEPFVDDRARRWKRRGTGWEQG
jgi:hypothetical protein